MDSIIGTVQGVYSSEDFLDKMDRIYNYERTKNASRQILSTFDNDEFLGGRLRRLGINFERLSDINFFNIVIIKSIDFRYVSDEEFIELFSTIPEEKIVELLNFLEQESNKSYEKYLNTSPNDGLNHDLTQDGEYFTWMENSKEEKHRLFMDIFYLVKENSKVPFGLLIKLV